MKKQLFTRIRLFFALLVLLPAMASAHAFVDRAEPRVGSEIAVAPPEIKVWFTQELEGSFCKLRVLDENGTQIDKKDCRLDKDDKKLLLVSVDHMSPGTYKVEWSVVSIDTHHTKGDFKFSVK